MPEEEKAIEYLEDKIKYLETHIKNYEKSDCKTTIYHNLIKEKESLEIILNLIKSQQEELEKKDKIIDEAVAVIIDSSICDYFIKDNCKHYAGENKKTCDNCIKQHFEKKVEESNEN